jgi:hypothetical protein
MMLFASGLFAGLGVATLAWLVVEQRRHRRRVRFRRAEETMRLLGLDTWER